MKICVVTQEYPSQERPDAMAFTHARNIIFKNYGHEITVLNFSARIPYAWDGIQVVGESQMSDSVISGFDIFVFHSPNLRNHLRFILKAGDLIKSKVIVSHGFEFIDWYTQKGAPFDFQMTLKKHVILSFLHLYDMIKIKTWAWYFRSQKKSSLAVIFVSNWLRENAQKCLRLNLADCVNTVRVIPNPVHPVFTNSGFKSDAQKKADFVTIRTFDDRKYAVDVIVEIARRNPDKKFHLFGEGQYFLHHQAPPNLKVEYKKFKQSELPDLLNNYHAALLPTRWDSQGVLMCEIASFGMPIVVSDIPICRNMIGEFENVAFIDNDDPILPEILNSGPLEENRREKFGPDNTILKELDLFEEVVADQRKYRPLPGGFFLSSLLLIGNSLFKYGALLGPQVRTRE